MYPDSTVMDRLPPHNRDCELRKSTATASCRCVPPVGKATINGRIVALMRLVRRVRGPQEPRVPSA